MMLDGEIIVRAEAIRLELPRYFTGKPCKNGHMAERSTQKKRCVECDREYRIIYDSTHRGQEQARKAAWQKAHPGYLSDYQKAHLEEHRITDAKWRKANPEKVKTQRIARLQSTPLKIRGYSITYRARNPEKTRAYAVSYNQAHPGKMQQRSRQYRARQLGAEGTHSLTDIQAMWNSQEGLCGVCWVDLTGRFDVEHIVPLSRGGSDSPENLWLSCPDCNKRKSTKTLEEWFSQMATA